MIEAAVSYLIDKDRFFADFIQQMDRVYTHSTPTLSISVDRRIILKINPDFWAASSLQRQADLLIHEVKHLIYSHHKRARAHGADKDGTWTFHNLCLDLVVNQGLETLKGEKNAMTVENMRSMGFSNLQDDQMYDYYLEYFKKEKEQVADIYKKLTDIGVHEFNESEEADEAGEVIDGLVRYAVRRALEATERAGQHPGDRVKPWVEKLLKGTNSWRRELRRFPQQAEVCAIESSRKHRNRRFGIQFPGDKKVRRLKGALGFDVSGSMMDEKTLAAISNEIDKIIETGTELTVMFFDTQIRDEFDIVTHKDLLNKYNHLGGGGTLFKPVFDRCAQLNVDFLIMMTDMYNGDPDLIIKPKYPVLWGVIGNANPQAPFGRIVMVDANE